MKERGFCLLLFCVPVGLIMIVTTFFLISAFRIRENTYYIPEVDLYIKTQEKPKDKYGYVFFSKNNKFSSSLDEMDYIQILKRNGTGNLVEIFINFSSKKEIYIVPNLISDDILFINSKNCNIEKVNYEGCIYYENLYLPSFLENEEFTRLIVKENFEYIYIKEKNDTLYKKLFPL